MAGDLILIREGFCLEKVSEVIYDFVDSEIEIRINNSDSGNHYGDCLVKKLESKS